MLKTKWFKALAGISIALVIFFVTLPIGAKYLFTRYLLRNGADSVKIEKLRYNPFMARLSLEGLDISTGGRTILSESEMVLNVRLLSLIGRDVRLQSGEYKNLFVDLEQYQDGRWRIGFLDIAASPSGEAQGKERANDPAKAWAFLADHMKLEDCRVKLKTPDLDLLFFVESAELGNFSTRNGQADGYFHLQGDIDGSAVSISLDQIQVSPGIQAEGDVLVEKFKLEELQKLLEDVLPRLQGEFGLKGRVAYHQQQGKKTELSYAGSLRLAQAQLASGNVETAGAQVQWEGNIDYENDADKGLVLKIGGELSAEDFDIVFPAEKDDAARKEAGFGLNWKGSVNLQNPVNAKGAGITADGALKLRDIVFSANSLSARYSTSAAGVSWQGGLDFGPTDGEGSKVNLKGTLAANEVSAELPAQKIRFTQELVEADLDSTLLISNNISVDGLGSFHLKNLQIERGENREQLFSLGGLRLEGFEGEGGKKLKFRGLAASDISAELSGNSPLQVIIPGAELQDVSTDDFISYTGESFNVAGVEVFSLQNEEKLARQTEGGENRERLFSLGGLRLEGLEGEGGKKLKFRGLAASDISAMLSGKIPLQVIIPGVELQDVSTDDFISYTGKSFNVVGVEVFSLQNEEKLANFDALTVDDISAGAAGDISAGLIHLSRFTAMGAKMDLNGESPLTVGSAKLSGFKWSKESGLQGDTLRVDDLIARVIREQQGDFRLQRRLAALQAAGQKQVEAETEPAISEEKGAERGIDVSLEKLMIGGNNIINYEDYTLAVPFKSDLAIEQLQVLGLDTSRPDQKTEILFDGKLEKRAPLKVRGFLQPFKENLLLDLTLELKNYPLASLSSYTVQSVGTALSSGQLKINSSIGLADNKLDIENNIVFQQLETERISEELAKELDNQLPVSLDSALSLLRDSDGDIYLDVPVSGPVKELDIGVADVLTTALSKAVVPAATGYLVYALGPYAALAYVGMKVGEKMLQISLPPVEFNAGESRLAEDQYEYLSRVAKILGDHPMSDVQVCPTVVSWELLSKEEKERFKRENLKLSDEDKQKLSDLGQLRADAVQNYLVEKYSVVRERLLICDTKIEMDHEAVPAVLMHMSKGS